MIEHTISVPIRQNKIAARWSSLLTRINLIWWKVAEYGLLRVSVGTGAHGHKLISVGVLSSCLARLSVRQLNAPESGLVFQRGANTCPDSPQFTAKLPKPS